MNIPSSSSSSLSPFPPNPLPIPEDTVVYSIYPDLPSPSLSPSAATSLLHSLHLQILSLLPSLLPPNHLWHRDPFSLSPSLSPLPRLHGLTRFSHSLDDEWLLVSLLLRISSLLPSLSLQLSDSDGDFLLIESAYHLPRWLTPDRSPNRVFLRAGHLHIIPPSLSPQPPSLPSALRILSSSPDPSSTLAPAPAQSAILSRASSVRTSHLALARLPLPVARVLHHEPSLISLAVEAFYDRDVDSMKLAARMERFSGETVRIPVRMTRAMYAQLVRQSFAAPRCYPPLPVPGEKGFAEAELGMKIACGFEMMYGTRRREGEEGKGETWDAFLRSLESSGCFEGVLPGSAEYRRIVDGAMEYYKKTSLFSRARDMLSAPVRRIDEILSLEYSINDFEGKELPPPDDDSWLYDGEDELNSVIADRQKEMDDYELERSKQQKSRKQRAHNNSSAKSDDFNFKEVAESMQAFVQKLSSFEGAEVPENRNSSAVEVDVAQFIKDMESVLGPVSHGDNHENDEIEEGFTSSSEMDFDVSEDEDDITELCEDDDTNDAFMQSYSDVLNKELNATTLKKSFIRASEEPNNYDDEGTSNASKDTSEELTPVDVDVNLVKSLLDSFSSQEGLPGPASNLLGLMGLKVPHNENKK